LKSTREAHCIILMEVNITVLTKIIESVISPNNAIRNEAEASLERVCKENPRATLAGLLQIAQTSPGLADLSFMLILKRIITQKDVNGQLGQEDFLNTIQVSVSMVDRESTSLPTMRRISEILVQIYRGISDDDSVSVQTQMAQFFEVVNQFNKSANKNHKMFVLYTLQTFAEYSFNPDLLQKFSQEFAKYFAQYLSDADKEVQFEAASAFTTFLSYIESNKGIAEYATAFPTLLNLLVSAVQSDEEKGRKMVHAIEELIRFHPKFVKDHIDQLLNIFTEIAGERSLKLSVRNAGMTALSTMAAVHSAALKKTALFTDKTIPVLMRVITEQPDDLTEWLTSTDKHELSNNSVQAAAAETFARFNTEIGAKFMLQKTINRAGEFILKDNWKEKYAGLITLSMLFEGCREHFESDLPNFVNLITPCLIGHPKVQFAAMTCIALLGSEFTPELQINYHHQIVPIVGDILNNSDVPVKLRMQSVSMFVNFFRDLLEQGDEDEYTFLDTYTTPIMGALLKLFDDGVRTSKMELVDEVVNLISILAALRQTKFAEYYPTLMPVLKKLVFELPNNTDANNKLRALAISCVGYVIASYMDRPQEIESDIIEMMQNLVGLQDTIAEDDVQNKAIIEAYLVMVGALQTKFLPFLEPVARHLLRNSNKDIKFSVEDQLTDTDSKGIQTNEKGEKQFVVDMKLMGGKKVISMNHNILDMKITAFEGIKRLCADMKTHMAPYAEQIIQVLKTHITFKLSNPIRENCYKTVKHLMGVFTAEEDKAKVFNMFAPDMLDFAKGFLTLQNSEKSYHVLKHLKAAGEQLKAPLIAPAIVESWLEVLKQATTVCEICKKEVIKEAGNLEKLDEDEREDFETNFAEPNMLMHVVMDTCALLMKLYRQQIEDRILNLGGYFYSKSTNFVVEDEIHYAVMFYAELFNNCSKGIVDKGYQTVLDICLPHIEKTTDINFQQTGSFLVGILAKNCDRQQFGPYLERALSLFYRLLGEVDAKSDEKKERTETIVGAYGKVCMYQLNIGDEKNQGRVRDFVETLPLQTDPEEAKYINKLFLKELSKQNQNLLATDQLKLVCKSAVVRINSAFENNPESSDILDTEGTQLLSQIVPQLA
jgi:Importin repeat